MYYSTGFITEIFVKFSKSSCVKLFTEAKNIFKLGSMY